jgi:hypothetical protein
MPTTQAISVNIPKRFSRTKEKRKGQLALEKYHAEWRVRWDLNPELLA